ncbi:hypothetical protein [Nocardioides humi]|uniref:hypothetical protein n=1 Tax=Nocardioides humi TaxID=449461 RepID=UPI00112EF4E6|nr:hypothetical protein [Nocardioides humi]
MAEVEDAITRAWRAVRFTENQITEFSTRARDDLHRSAESGARLLADQRRRLAELERHRQKLLDAYMADALPVEVLKERQAQIAAEITDAKRLIDTTQTTTDEVNNRLEQVIDLLRHAERLYASVGDQARQLLNTAVFGPFEVDSRPDDAATGPVTAHGPLNPLIGAVLATQAPDGAHAALSGAETAGTGSERTPGELSLTEGSNLIHLAEAEGFEPSMGL